MEPICSVSLEVPSDLTAHCLPDCSAICCAGSNPHAPYWRRKLRTGKFDPMRAAFTKSMPPTGYLAALSTQMQIALP